MENIIELTQITKKFGDNLVIPTLDLSIRRGEFLTLLGPSGCGKTTLLRMIAGFETPTSGTIRLDGQDMTSLPPYRRNVNTVFQNYALFPHLSVFDNIAFGLVQKGEDKAQIRNEVKRVLDMVEMNGFEARKPRELSGGQQQRIALARAIVNQPKVLLLDEPLAALDLKLRKSMQTELKNLHRQLGITFIFVTHDQEEALTMSDRIAVMQRGHIDQLDIPQRVYDQPTTRFVADFIGENNTLAGTYDPTLQSLQMGPYQVPVESAATRQGKALLFIRPEHVNIHLEEPIASDTFVLPAILQDRMFLGHHWKITCQVQDGPLVDVTVDPEKLGHLVGKTHIWLSWPPQKSTLSFE
jgi:spermidine/putrescine transport system ATP-binding protein